MVDPNSVDRTNIRNIEAGNISNENAVRRANEGADQPFSSIQAFDGIGECLSRQDPPQQTFIADLQFHYNTKGVGFIEIVPCSV